MGKINLGYFTGKTLTYGVYSPAGVEREVGTSLPESPAGSRRYIAESATVQEGDDVIVLNATPVIVAYGEFTKEGLNWQKNG